MARRSDDQLIIKVGASLEELKRALAEGRVLIDNTSTSLGRMTASLRGDKLLAEAQKVVTAVEKAGGAAVLTGREQAKVNAQLQEAVEKYRLIGKEAPASLLALEKATHGATQKTSALHGVIGKLGPMLAATFSVGAITGGIRSIVQWADDLDEVATGIGMNVERLQQLQHAWATTGSSVEAGVRAIQTMQEKLSDGAAAGAVEKLGLDLYAIKQLAPEDQFDLITEALRKVTDQTDYAAIGADIFGKTWKSVGISVRNGMQEAADSAQKLTEEQIRNIARLQAAWEGLVIRMKVAAGQFIGGIGSPSADITPGEMARRQGTNLDWLFAGANTVPASPLAAPGGALRLSGATAAEIEAIEKATKRLTDSVKAQKREADLLKVSWNGLRQAWADSAAREVLLTGLHPDDPRGWIGSYEMETATLRIKEWTDKTEVAIEATSDWRSELGLLSESFRRFAQTSGTGGLGAVAGQIANVVGSMQIAADAGTRMKLAWDGFDAAGQKMTSGQRWASAAASVLQYAAALDQVTQSSSRWQNAVSGAVTGASAGYSMLYGTPYAGYGAAAGAAAGFIYGATKDNTSDDVTRDMIDSWTAAYGGAAELERQFRLASGQMWVLNQALQAGSNDLKNYESATKAVGQSLSSWQKIIAALKSASVGTKTLADALGVETTQAQFQRLGIYTSAIFGKMLRETGSLAEALALVSDTLDSMIAAADKFGFSSTGALAELLGLRGVLTSNPDLAARITGLGQIGQGLGPQLLKSMNLAPTFGADLSEAFQQLLGRGVGQSQALLLMQGPLQALWEAANNPQTRRSLDADTLALLQLAESQGFIGADLRDVSLRQLDVLTQIRDLLAGTAPGDEFEPGFGGTAPGIRGGGARRDRDITGYAGGTGGYQWFGSGRLAMLHGWEKVSRPQDDAVGAGLAGQPIHVHVEVNRREIARAIVPEIPAVTREWGVR